MDILATIAPLNSSVFSELSLVIAIGALMAIIMKLLKQPLIVSHILTGLVVGPFFLNFLHSTEVFQLFSEIGISILLFTVGLNLSPTLIKQFGRISLLTGIGQVVLTSSIGFFIARFLGYTPIVATYIGVALAFSSTIIVLKLLADKNELETLHAKITVGFLLVQDFIALILLFSIPIIANPNLSSLWIIAMLIKGILMTGIVWIISQKILKPLSNFLAHSQELLFLFSLSWGFIIASIFKLAGFSLETGALIAGVSLAALPIRYEISARLTSLRDFFIVIFFIMLGTQIAVTDIITILPKALIFSFFILIGNPLIVMIIMRNNGYRKKTSFKTALAVAQISEFSLILATLGVTLSHLDVSILSMITMIGLITIFISSYLILHADSLYDLLEKWLGWFELKNLKEKAYVPIHFPVMIFGCNRIGYDFVQAFKKEQREFLVIDYNPETIEELTTDGVSARYGDASDIALLEELNDKKLEIVISTIPNLSTNMLITETIRKTNKKTIIMTLAHTINDALTLYEKGTDYVILPHFLGGQYAADMIIKNGMNRRRFSTLKNQHVTYLHAKLTLGHEHPTHTPNYNT